MKATVGVHQNLLKLSKMYGVDFKGHEKESVELLMQIDGSRQVRVLEPNVDIKKTRCEGCKN